MDRRTVLLFTKPAIPGRVKTRLIGELSAVDAARLHAAILDDLVARLPDEAYELRIAWALEDGESMPGSELPGLLQRGDDLGERLYNGLADVSREAPFVAAIGSDHPRLAQRDLVAAFDALAGGREADVVLGPALDGGYYLIALRREALSPALFHDIPWSSSAVLAKTVDRCEGLGLKVHLLPPAGDVDTPADLERLEVELNCGAVRSPHTAALLRSWGRLAGEEGR